MPNTQGVSLCMIVKDEQDMLADCMRSVEGVVDEIIVVDTGSTDKTREIAREFGARVYDYAWNGSFADARNRSLELCDREWALFLDADERLVREDIPKLERILASGDCAGAHFKVLNYLGEGGGQYTVHNAFRLLRNTGEFRFAGDIHEQLARADGSRADGKFLLTDIRLIHLGYLDSVAEKKGKRSRNLAILEREISRDPDNPFTLFNLGNEYMAMKDYERALAFYGRAKAKCEPGQAYTPHLLFRRAMCLHQTGRHADALVALDEGLRTYPGCTDMQCLKGQILMDGRRDVMAIECFERAMELGEPHPTLKFMDGCATTRPFASLATIYKRQGDYRKAAMFFGRTIASDNALHFALYEAAACLAKLGMPPEEVEKSIASLFADVQNPLNRILLADALLSCGFSDRAEAHIDALKDAPDCATDVQILSGKCAFLKRDYMDAVRLLKEALGGKRPRALARGFEDAAKTLTAGALIAGAAEDMKTAREAVAAQFGNGAARMLDIMRACIAGESADNAGIADHERALALFLSLIEIVLKAGEFEAFEKLLYALNYIERPNLLISLASVYENCGYHQMAAETVLRSIRELNEITPEGGRILADSLSMSQRPTK